LGIVEEAAADEKDDLSRIYLDKHPELKHFVENPTNALMRIAVSDYIIATFEGTRYMHIEDSE